MTESSRDETYLHDRGQRDQERLVGVAHNLANSAREACVRAGLQLGDRALDVGCGPIGALSVLAELVGPMGAVVGLDASPAALAHARRILTEQGVDNVTLVQADLNAVRPDEVCPPGPFDLAFCRLVLIHQADPVPALRRVAMLVRPGGRIVAHDNLPGPPYACFVPPVPAVERLFALHAAHMRGRGASPDVAYHYPALCEAAGLRLLSEQGGFTVRHEANDLLAIYRDEVLTSRAGLLAHDLATDEEIKALVGDFDAAIASSQHFGTSPMFVQMIAVVP